MSTVAELLHLNLHGVFGNRDAEGRRDAAARALSPDVVFIDHDGTSTGIPSLLEKAEALLSGAPADFVLVDDGPAYVFEDTGVQPWAFGPAGAPVVRGIDLVTVRDGAIASLTVLLAEA